ncbi:hypothetical protein BDN72DRAFT_780386 [Pluteus cervinus]|uniref:Uncharacterized protein n=1 Tax=Pluteus cervinus TaxID=181527 RepID=A0ACD3A288_9AGAR|nr:hypothetical protein BDN72DRAFT_780386 [Pluteus cervinus]
MASNNFSSSQYSLFKDTLASHLLSRVEVTDPTELDDFTSYLSQESWSILPTSVQTATYETRNEVPDVDKLSLDATPTEFIDTLVSYDLVPDSDDALKFLRKVVAKYVGEACAAPPPWSSTRTAECEICEREVPLTYHHLIPRSTHTKVLKKGWHPESQINSVAWLCRPCHSYVHHVTNNEDLAINFYTVELLLGREDIQKWKGYAAKQRFGVRRG